jgi:hypothetical protein
VHNAINLLETADKLKQLPVLEDALRHGELSGLMTAIAAGAAAEDPGKQKALLEQARNGSVGDLRREAEHIRAAARSEQDAIRAYEAIKAKRSLRWWTDSEGAFRLDGRLTPDAGARLIAEIQPEARRVFRQARDDKAREPFGAYVADALVNLVTGVQLPGASTVSGAAWPPAPSCGGAWPLGPSPASEPSASQGPNAGSPPSGSGGAGSPGGAGQDPGSPDSPAPRAGAGRRTSHSVILRVDLAALRRGELGQGEVCEIPGVGPVPLAVARQLLGDAFLKLVITDGVDVQSVCHIGRHVSAFIDTALSERDPVCVVPGCEVASFLERDHWREEYAKGGPTDLPNLCLVCRRHHYLKHHKGFSLRGGLASGSGSPRTTVPPAPANPRTCRRGGRRGRRGRERPAATW